MKLDRIILTIIVVLGFVEHCVSSSEYIESRKQYVRKILIDSGLDGKKLLRIDGCLKTLCSETSESGVTTAYKNLENALPASETDSDGFVYASHEIYMKKLMNVKWGEKAVAYYQHKVFLEKGDSWAIFSGSDPSRFLLCSSDSNIIAISQSMLAEGGYLEYIKYFYGKNLRVPPGNARVEALIRVMKEKQYTKNDVDKREPTLLHDLNQDIARRVYEDNLDIKWFVSEGYIMEWMFPFLLPNGLYMELNNSRCKLTDAVIKRDREFWAEITKEFEEAEWGSHNDLCIEFARARSAIGGLYSYHNNKEEAAYAYRQAIALCPAFLESYFRLCHEVLIPDEKLNEARVVLNNVLLVAGEHEFCRKTVEKYFKLIEKKESQMRAIP